MNSDVNFLIGVGFEKCGTTSFFALCEDHPAFIPTVEKECSFFSHNFSNGLDFYASQFEDRLIDTQRWHVDITPAYGRRTEALEQIAALSAKKKILLFLRHPVKRAYSHYIHDLFHHILRGQQNDMFKSGLTYSFDEQLIKKRHAYLPSYAESVKRLRALFPQENIRIIIFEDMVANWRREATALEDFLGLKKRTLSRLKLPTKNEASKLPAFFGHIETDENRFTLAQAGPRATHLFKDLSKEQLLRAYSLQGSVTTQITEDVSRWYIEKYSFLIEETEDILDIKLDKWRMPFEKTIYFVSPNINNWNFLNKKHSQ